MAPEPALAAHPPTLRLAYRIARDPPHFAVVRFDGVQRHAVEALDEVGLRGHPLYPRGLRSHRFHEVLPPLLEEEARRVGLRRWLVVFRDELVEVLARRARVVVRAIEAPGARAALAMVGE